MGIDNNEILTLINDCQNRYKKLSDWEVDFLGDIEYQYRKKGKLTDSQNEILNNLWEKATS